MKEIAAGDLDFLDILNEEYPGYTFGLTPAIYSSDSDQVRRGIMVRLPSGELQKLRHSWNREQTQDAVITDPEIAEAFETAIKNELLSAIRKEMKLLIQSHA